MFGYPAWMVVGAVLAGGFLVARGLAAIAKAWFK